MALQNKPKRTAEVGRTELVVLIEGVTEEVGYRDAPNQKMGVTYPLICMY